MNPLVWWPLWSASTLAVGGIGYGMVRVIVREAVADKARAVRGNKLAGAVAFPGRRPAESVRRRRADEEYVQHAESSIGSGGGKSVTPPEFGDADAKILPFLPRGGFEERFPSLAEAIEAEQIRTERERVLVPVATWPEAFRPENGGA